MKSQVDWEFEVLTTSAGDSLIAEIQNADPSPGITLIEKLRRTFGREMTEAAIRIHSSRQKAVGKLPNAERLWLDPVRVEQATHQLVAEHKSQRFVNKDVVDLCCGIGGDSLSFVRRGKSLLALDKDQATLRRLHYNLQVVGATSVVQTVKADASRICWDTRQFLHVDPDRRAGDRSGRPSFQIDAYQPGPDMLMELMSSHPGGAVKLSPGSHYEILEERAAKQGIATELEVISLFGECREATLWFGSLAGDRTRSATILPNAVQFRGTGSVSGNNRFLIFSDIRPGMEIVELDPAILRAGLAAEFAQNFGLSPVITDCAFVTRLVSSAVFERISRHFATFEVVAVASADRRAIRQMLQHIGWQNVIVKTRGRLTAAEIQNWIKSRPTGTSSQTLLVWTVPGQRSVAIAATRKPVVG